MKYILIILISATFAFQGIAQKAKANRYLYVAAPGIRDYLGYGGHGILVFDMDHGHRFVKRIKTQGLHPNGKPSNVKGVAVSVPLNSIYVSTLESLQRIDLTTEKVIWERLQEVATACLFHQMAKRCICLLWRKISGMWLIAKLGISSKKLMGLSEPIIPFMAPQEIQSIWVISETRGYMFRRQKRIHCV